MHSFRSDVMYQLFRTIYTAPHIRVVPYLAGMLIGYLGNWMEINLLEINRTWVRVGWNVFSGFLLLPILIAHDPSTLSTFTCALTYSFLKFISSLCVGGLIILCAFSPEGRVQRFLSHGCFVHLNKMSYGMYVIHPIVILLVFGLQSHPVLLDDISWVSTYFVHWARVVHFDLTPVQYPHHSNINDHLLIIPGRLFSSCRGNNLRLRTLPNYPHRNALRKVI